MNTASPLPINARRQFTRPRSHLAGALALASIGTACVNVAPVYYGEEAAAGTGATSGGPRRSVGGSGSGGTPTEGGSAIATGPGSGTGGWSVAVGGRPAGGMGGEGFVLPTSDRAGCPTPEGAGGSSYEFPPPGCPCHEGPLYTSRVNVNGKTDYYPIECEPATNVSVGQTCSAVAEQYIVFSCADDGAGFNGDGEFVERRSDGDIPLLRLEHPNDSNPWGGFDGLGYKYHCHAGGTAIGTYECGDVPVELGIGGVITPGTYALTSLVQYGTPTFRIAGNNFQQTLLVTERSLALLSDDSAVFIFNGAYLYQTEGALIHFDRLSATYSETDPAYFFPWTETAAYTATDGRLDIYAPKEGFAASFERVE